MHRMFTTSAITITTFTTSNAAAAYKRTDKVNHDPFILNIYLYQWYNFICMHSMFTTSAVTTTTTFTTSNAAAYKRTDKISEQIKSAKTH